jgi:hypothetical protein
MELEEAKKPETKDQIRGAGKTLQAALTPLLSHIAYHEGPIRHLALIWTVIFKGMTRRGSSVIP